jgi:hypothetical protein
MARFLRQAEACTGGHKGAGLSDCNVPSRGRRDLRSGERTAGAIPRPSSHLRSDPSTLAARQPVPFAGHRRCGKSRPTQRGGPGLQPAIHPARGDMGCSSPRIEEGSRGPPGALRCARSKPAPCPSLGGARPMLPGEAIHRAPSLHRGGALPGASVLASKEATPPQGVRGEGRQTAWLLGVISRSDSNAGRAIPDGGLPTAPDGGSRHGW